MFYKTVLIRKRHRFVHYSEHRKDPMPYCGHNQVGRWFHRRPRTAQELRENAKGHQFKGYSRGRRRNLPTSWDDIYYYHPKCWKDCTKRRKQWKGRR